MPLLTAAEAQAHIRSDLTEAELQDVIDDEEAELIARLGPHGDGVTPITLNVIGYGGDLFLPRAVVSVTTVGGSASGWTLYASQGRIAGTYTGEVAVVAVPADDRRKRKRALIDLVRLTVQRTAFKAESVAGEHSYTAPASWEAERASIYRRMIFTSI
jgi:hypothetical protein